MKYLLLLSYLTISLFASPTIPLPDGPSYIFSAATRVENGFLYEYNMRRDLWRYDFTYFELWDVLNPNIWNPQSNLDFNLRFQGSSIVFDGFNMGNQPDNVRFSFISPNSPQLGNGKIVFEPSFAEDIGRVLIPNGPIIPEPNLFPLFLFGAFILFRRRRHSVK